MDQNQPSQAHPVAHLLFYLVVTVTLSFFFVFPRAESTEYITDEDISSSLGHSEAHELMTKQRERLRAILDSFIIGDLEGIERIAGEMTNDLHQVPAALPKDFDKDIDQWKIMSEIVTSAEGLNNEARAKNYPKAYNHFASLTRKCIECHELRRSWGLFPEPPKAPRKPAKK